MPEPQDATQIQGLPPGAILKPIQAQAPEASSIEGLPPGAVLKPISQPMVTNSAGETMPADIAARHALTREGQDSSPQPQDARAASAEGAGKEAYKTVQGVGNLVNKVLPSSLQLPTEESKITSTLPEGPERQRLLEQSRKDLELRGPAEWMGGIGENILEFASGEEALKGLSLAGRLAKLQKVAQFVEEHPRIAQALHVGANVMRSAAVGGAQGGVKGAAEGDTTRGVEAGATGAAIGGAVGEAAPVVTQKLGSVLEKHAPDFVNSLLRANNKANYLYGKNPGQAIIDEGINAPRSISLAGQLDNVHGQLEAAGERLDSQVKQTLSEPKVAAIKQDIVPTIQNTIEDAKKYITQQTGIDAPAYLDKLNQLESSMLTKYDTDGNVVGTLKGARLSPAEISDVKKSIGKNTQWKLDPRDPEFQLKGYVNSIRKQIYGKLADLVESAAETGAPGSNIKGLNARYANTIEAQGLLENRIAQEHGTGAYQAAIRKGEWGAALASIFSGHPYLGLAFIANRIARSAPGRVLEARGAATVGEALQTPTAEGVTQSVKKVVPAVGAQVGQWIRMQLSDGSQIESHPEDVSEVQKRDPGAKVVTENAPAGQ
jgi:hypothetical protein